MPTSETADDKRFKRLSLCGTLSLTASMYCSGMKVFLPLAALFTAVNVGVWAILLLIIKPLLGDFDAEQLSDPEYLLANIRTFYGMVFVNLLVKILVGSVSSGTMIRAVVDLYMKKEPDFTTCLTVGLKRAPTMLFASFLAVLGTAIGYLFLFVPGVYLSIQWFLITPIIVVEGMRALPSFKRSSNLVSGSWCYVFCTYTICFVLTVVVQMVVMSMCGISGDGGASMFSMSGSAVTAIPTIFMIPIFSIMMTVMYLNLRIEKEGLNFETLAENMGESGAADVSAYTLLTSDEPKDEAIV